MAVSATAHVVDFSNVKDGGQFNTNQVPSGDYLAKITKVEDAKSKGDDESMYVFTIKLTKYTGYAYPYYCKLTENQLWKLRNLLIAAGMTVPKKKLKLDPNKVVGKTVGVTMEDDEFEGKMKSVVQAVFPAAELMDGAEVDDDADDEDVEDDEEVDETEEVEDEEEEDTTDEYDGMDRLELRRALKKLDPDLKTSKSQSDDDLRDLARKLADDDDDEDEEEEEVPAPKKKAPVKKAGAKKKAADITDDELEEIDIDDL